MNLIEIFRLYPDQQACIERLEELRFGGGPYCPLCGCVNVARKSDGDRLGRWNCYACRSSFNVLSGTIFQKTRIPLQKWFLAITLMLNSRKGISSHEMARDLEMVQGTAWYMMKRIRQEMANRQSAVMLQGVIEADETYVGGRPRKINKGKCHSDSPRGRGTNKTPILGAVQRGGKVVAKVVDDASGETVLEFCRENIVALGSRFITDGWRSYRRVAEHMRHDVLARYDGQFRYGVHTNTIESVWAILKRAWYGAHHHYHWRHTYLYVAEMCYKYNSRVESKPFDAFLLHSVEGTEGLNNSVPPMDCKG